MFVNISHFYCTGLWFWSVFVPCPLSQVWNRSEPVHIQADPPARLHKLGKGKDPVSRCIAKEIPRRRITVTSSINEIFCFFFIRHCFICRPHPRVSWEIASGWGGGGGAIPLYRACFWKDVLKTTWTVFFHPEYLLFEVDPQKCTVV